MAEVIRQTNLVDIELQKNKKGTSEGKSDLFVG